jgi:hypothetical protein
VTCGDRIVRLNFVTLTLEIRTNIEAIRRGMSDVFTAKLLFFLAMCDLPDVTEMIQVDTSPGKQAKLVRIRNLKGHGIWVLGS